MNTEKQPKETKQTWLLICIDSDGEEMFIDEFTDELAAHRFKNIVKNESWVEYDHEFEVRLDLSRRWV